MRQLPYLNTNTENTAQRYTQTERRWLQFYTETHTDTTTWVCVIYMSVCVCVCTLHISWAAKYFSWLRQLLLTQFRIVISLWFLLLHFIYALAIYRCCLPFEAGLFFYVASCLHMANVTIAIAAAASTASYELHCCIVKSWTKQPISESRYSEREEREREIQHSAMALFAVGLIESASCLLADSKICDSQMLRSALAGTYIQYAWHASSAITHRNYPLVVLPIKAISLLRAKLTPKQKLTTLFHAAYAQYGIAVLCCNCTSNRLFDTF